MIVWFVISLGFAFVIGCCMRFVLFVGCGVVMATWIRLFACYVWLLCFDCSGFDCDVGLFGCGGFRGFVFGVCCYNCGFA